MTKHILAFKPKLIPTLITLPMLVVLIGLGFWQLQRMEWKAELIAQRTRLLYMAPLRVSDFSALAPEQVVYRPLQISVRLKFLAPVPVMGMGKQGAGYFLYYPIKLGDHAVFLRGEFVPGFTPPALPGRVENLRGIAIFVPADHPLLKAAARPYPHPYTMLFFVKPGAEFEEARNELINIPNNHLTYAFIWFSLAIALLVIYFISHGQKMTKITGD